MTRRQIDRRERLENERVRHAAQNARFAGVQIAEGPVQEGIVTNDDIGFWAHVETYGYSGPTKYLYRSESGALYIQVAHTMGWRMYPAVWPGEKGDE